MVWAVSLVISSPSGLCHWFGSRWAGQPALQCTKYQKMACWKGELFTLDGKCQKNVLHRIEWLDLIWRSISLVRHIKASWCQLSKSAVGTATPFAIRCCMAHGTPSPKPAGTACHQRTGDHTVACGGSGCCLKNGAVCAPHDNFKMGKMIITHWNYMK